MKIMLVEYVTDFYYKVAKKLITKGGEISYIITTTTWDNKGQDYTIDPDFKNSEIIDVLQFYSPDTISNINVNNPNALSKDLINEFSDVKDQVLRNSDRHSFYPINMYETNRIFYELLLYFYTFFQKNKNNIDLILFPSTPHMSYDNIIYYMAKYFDIKTLIVEVTLINGISLI